MGNMKANRKFKNEDEAVSAVIGVILMVAITVAIAATVYVYVSGMLGGGPSASATVGMVQTANYITIQKVDGGPIEWASCTLTCVNASGGDVTSTASLSSTNPDGNTIVSGGDTIAIGGSLPTAGSPYTITIVYGGDAIGTVKYVPV